MILYLVAAVLRLFNLGVPQLWYDETFTYVVSSLDVPNLLTAVAGDVHPPLYYLLMSPLAHLGVSETLLRLPSVALSLLAIWITGQIATQLGLSQRAKLIGQVLMVLLPGQIYYAQEARMYAMLLALVLAWLWMVLRRRWVPAAILGTLALYTHNYAVFYWLVIAAVAIDGELRRPVILGDHNPYPDLLSWKPGDQANMRGAALAVIAPVLAWLPWQIVLLSQMQYVATGYWIQPVTFGSALYALLQILWSIYPPSFSLLAVLVTLTLLLWSIIHGRRAAGKSAWQTMILLGFGPLLLWVGLSLAWKPVLLYRGLIGSVPLICLLIAAALDTLTLKKLVYVAGIGVPLLVGGLFNYYTQIPTDKGMIYQDIDQLRQQWQPGDLLIHTNASTYFRWRTYAQDLPQIALPICAPNGGEISEQTREAINAYTVAAKVQRVWLLWDSGPTSVPCEAERAEHMIAGKVPTFLLASTRFATSGLYLLEAYTP